MADAEAMKRSAGIVARDIDKRLIVVSATSGTTNSLTTLCSTLPINEKRAIVDQIEEKHQAICSELIQPDDTRSALDDIIKELRIYSERDIVGPKQKDEILACGERLSSLLFAAFLNEAEPGTLWFDAREVIKTDNAFGSAEPDIEAIEHRVNERLRPLIKENKVVSQGFIGSDPDGFTTTLGRE